MNKGHVGSGPTYRHRAPLGLYKIGKIRLVVDEEFSKYITVTGFYESNKDIGELVIPLVTGYTLKEELELQPDDLDDMAWRVRYDSKGRYKGPRRTVFNISCQFGLATIVE